MSEQKAVRCTHRCCLCNDEGCENCSAPDPQPSPTVADVLDVEAVRAWLKAQLEGIYRSSGTVDGHRAAANFQRAVALCDEVDRLRAALRRVVEAYEADVGVGWSAEVVLAFADARALLGGTDESFDTGHMSLSCPCGHHWDSHVAVVGGCTVCSCEAHPPNQPVARLQ